MIGTSDVSGAKLFCIVPYQSRPRLSHFASFERLPGMLASGATEIRHAYRIVRPDQPVEEGEVLVTGPYRSADPIGP